MKIWRMFSPSRKCHDSGIAISNPAEHSMIINNCSVNKVPPSLQRPLNRRHGGTAATFDLNVPEWWMYFFKNKSNTFSWILKETTSPHYWFNGKNVSNTDEPWGGFPGVSTDTSAITRIVTGSAVDASYRVDLFPLNYGTRWSQIHRSLITSLQLRVLL